MLEKFITKQKSGYADFNCEKCGHESCAICKDGDALYVGQTLKIKGNSDLSDTIRFNEDGCVYSIRLIKNPSLGEYDYEIEVKAHGPNELGAGSGYLRFTDKTGDTYCLRIPNSDKKMIRVVDYNSEDPRIIKVEWSNHCF